MISCVYHDRVDCDNNTPNPKQRYQHFSAVRKLEDFSFPPDISQEIKKQNLKVEWCMNERILLEYFIGKMK